MILLIDQGNSAIKWCIYHNGQLGEFNTGDLSIFESDIKSSTNKLTSIYVSCVKNQHQLDAIRLVLENCNIFCPMHIAETGIKHGKLENGYNNYTQLGVDRWLAMIACWHTTEAGFIVVDAGSALTLDIVNNEGQHLGGHIIPGLTMQKKLLLDDTDQIILDEEQASTIYQLGQSTATCVHNGCVTNLCCYIERMWKQNDNSYQVFVTGGDALQLSSELTIAHQIRATLVLEGLYLSLNNVLKVQE